MMLKLNLKEVEKVLEEWIRGNQNEDGAKGKIDWSKWSRYLLALVVCIGLLALIWPVGKSQPAKVAVQSSPSSVDQAKENLCQELQSILSQIDGAGKVGVSITLSSNGVKNYASNSKNEIRETSEQDRNGGDRKIREENLSSDIAVSGSSALLVEEKAPNVMGVLVVAEGAKDAAIREKLTDATATLLNISPHQVSVVARKGE